MDCPACDARDTLHVYQHGRDQNAGSGLAECSCCAARFIVDLREQRPVHQVKGDRP